MENSSKRIRNSTMQVRCGSILLQILSKLFPHCQLVSKLMGLSLLLLLLCQQSQPEVIEAPSFFTHCHDIFRQEGMVAMVIKSILDKVMDRLQKACVVDEYIDKVPNIIGGGLYCDLNLPHTVDMLLSYVKDNADRDCRKINGFMSRYLLL